MKIIVLGLSVTSSWGNGHATTYRALLGALHRRGHKIVFFEKDEEWYASNRDLPEPKFCELHLFQHWSQVLRDVRKELEAADVAVLGSFFPDGIQAAQEIIESKVSAKVFFDIDTPITVAKLRSGGAEYLSANQVPGFDLYLSFTAGPLLKKLQEEFGARRALPLYCTFDPRTYYPRPAARRFECDLSYMGTYAPDRQPKLEELLLRPARQLRDKHFIVAGPQYPETIKWPASVEHIRHLSPRSHPQFYSSSRLTLNLSRAHMVEWGFSPSVRLFEAAACGCPIVSDSWPGLEALFTIGQEIVVAERGDDILALLTGWDEAELIQIGRRGRERVMAEHSSARRAQEFENYLSCLPSDPATRVASTFEGKFASTPDSCHIPSPVAAYDGFEITSRASDAIKEIRNGIEVNLQNAYRSR